MKKGIKSLCAMLLVIVMTGSLFACDKTGDNGNGDGDGIVREKPTNVYKETAINIGENQNNIWNPVFHENRIYFIKTDYDEETGSSIQSLVSLALEGDGEERQHMGINQNQSTEENVYRGSYINNIAISNDGSLWLVIQEYYEDYSDPVNPIYENNSYLRKYDFEGNQLIEIDINTLLPDQPYVYINQIIFDLEGNMYANCGESIIVIDPESGEQKLSLKEDSGSYFSTVALLADGSVAAFLYDYEKGGQTLKRIDVATRTWGQSIETETTDYFESVMTGDGEYLIYFIKYGSGVFGLKGDGTVEEIVSFINSDIDSSSINGIIKYGENEFLMISHDYMSGNGTTISKLTRVPDGEIKESIMLTYACLYVDYEIRKKILNFNRTNGEYRIQVLDYSQYSTHDDWRAGYDQLNTDIISGKIPDMFSLEGLNMKNFANKGILYNLYDLMDSSEKHSKEDFVQAVLKADEINGKLYRLTPSYAIQTVAAKRSIVGDISGWTMDDVNAVLATMPEGTKTFQYSTKEDILQYSTRLAMDQFIDWDTGICNFGDNFIKLLEFADTFPTEIDWDAIYSDPDAYMEMENSFRENRVLLQQVYVSGYRAARDYMSQFGEEIAFVGFPTENKNGSVFVPHTQYGIGAQTKHPQVCFEFLASVIETEPDFSQSNGYFYGSFSLSRNYMEKVKQYELTPLKERPGYGDHGNDMIAYDIARPLPMPEPGHEDYEANYHLSQDEVGAIDRLFENTKHFYIEDQAINNIIAEEAAEFFAGRRSSADAARIIQSRVQILVSESM